VAYSKHLIRHAKAGKDVTPQDQDKARKVPGYMKFEPSIREVDFILRLHSPDITI
jgi:hypothetical protein